MKSWPKEDRYSWEKSEVMKEFESKILSNYSKIEKIAQQKLNISDVKNLGTELQKANVAAKQLKETLVGSADDGGLAPSESKDHQCNSAEDCAICHSGSSKQKEYSDDEVMLAKAEIIRDLQKMASEAIKNKNITLAYRIERTIAELEDDND